MSKEAAFSKKDLESMVVRYARSEKEVILLKKCKEDLERRLRDAVKEKEALLARVRGLTNDKASLIVSIDKKLVESANQVKEIEALREELKDRDAKWKVALAQLSGETDAYKECHQTLEATLQLVADLKNDNEYLRRELQRRELMDSPTAAEGIERQTDDPTEEDLDLGIAALFEREPRLVEELLPSSVNDELPRKLFESENNLLKSKIQILEREKLEQNERFSRLQESVDRLQAELRLKEDRINELDGVEESFKNSEELRLAMVKEIETLTESNIQLCDELDLFKRKEKELLETNDQLSKKLASLESQHDLLRQERDSLQDEVNARIKAEKEALENIADLKQQLQDLQNKYDNEVNLLVRKVAEKTKSTEDLKIKLDELENEHKVMQRRHLNSVKELNKELWMMKKRLENYESQMNGNGDQQQSIGSRTSSSTSLETCHQQNGEVPSSETRLAESEKPLEQLPELNNEMLVYRIIKLQKTLSKKQEKIDFLEEHNQQLLEEMKKKTKMIQHYVLREQSGALTTNTMDENKRQLAKLGGGVMASLYSSSPTDSAMSLDLSLEINKKLQAVLEDTILKNITLKENINTLGEEIERLKAKRKNHSLS